MRISDVASILLAIEVITDILQGIVGVCLCFGALKWRRGLITTVAVYWGLFLGVLVGVLITSQTGLLVPILVGGVIGLILFPILTCTSPAVNRFVVGFIVITKITFMITTEMARAGSADHNPRKQLSRGYDTNG